MSMLKEVRKRQKREGSRHTLSSGTGSPLVVSLFLQVVSVTEKMEKGGACAIGVWGLGMACLCARGFFA